MSIGAQVPIGALQQVERVRHFEELSVFKKYHIRHDVGCPETKWSSKDFRNTGLKFEHGMQMRSPQELRYQSVLRQSGPVRLFEELRVLKNYHVGHEVSCAQTKQEGDRLAVRTRKNVCRFSSTNW